MKKPFCSIIIVTYNSQIHLPKAFDCLEKQTVPPDQIILVDTGSSDSSYLEEYTRKKNVTVAFAEKNAGFCKGNNLGMAHVPHHADYVFLLNPDAFLTAHFLENAIAYMEKSESHRVGALTGTTYGFDIHSDHPTNRYDTTGVFRTWYGRWYDRGQGQDVNIDLFKSEEEVPAICGAVFFCRKKALDEIRLRKEQILDDTFYMYKEDIDLSLRLRKKGWSLIFLPELKAYHCRGWNHDRSKMPRRMRLCSAKNDLRLQKHLFSFTGLVYSGMKYLFVKFFDR